MIETHLKKIGVHLKSASKLLNTRLLNRGWPWSLLAISVVAGFLVVNCYHKELPSSTATTPIDKPENSTDSPKIGLWGLSQIGVNVIFPAFERLAQNTIALKESISLHCKAIPSVAQSQWTWNRDPLKKAFLKAMRSYHFTEAFQIGLIARSEYAMRKKIYSRPTNSYAIDREIAEKQASQNYVYKKQPTTMGFAALEYLIYEESLMNHCIDCGVESLEEWNQLPTQVKVKNRCHYMQFVVEILTEQAQQLRKAWRPLNGDIIFAPTYQEDFKTLKRFAVSLTHGLIFFDREIKDRRLGIPSGINHDLCGFDSCPEQSEHLRSKDSIHSLLYSAKGLWAIFTGDFPGEDSLKTGYHLKKDYNLKKNHSSNKNDDFKEGYGFEEWLVEKGHLELVQNFKAHTSRFIQNLEKLSHQHINIEALAQNVNYEQCKTTTTESRHVEICALYQDLKKVTDIYKTDFLLATDFGRPKNQGGDTD